MSKSVPELTAELAALQAEKQTFDGLLAEASTKQTELQASLDAANAKVTGLETDLSAKVAEVATLTEAKTTLTAEVATLKAEAKSADTLAMEKLAGFGFKAQEKGKTDDATEEKQKSTLTGLALVRDAFARAEK